MNGKTKLELTWIGKEERPRLEPRVLVEDREHGGAHILDADQDIYDNILIQGDNLLALKSLEGAFSGAVKCIYADPPYNTGSAFAYYDDGLEHSLWLSLLRERIEICRRLLRDDGSMWISIDDNEHAYLKILCDEIFGRSNFIANIIWEKRKSRENRRVFSFKHDYILVYAKERARFEETRNPVALNAEVLARYKNPDSDPRGPWQSVSANAQAGHATASQFYSLTLPSGRVVDPPAGRCWLYTKPKMEAEIAAGNIWFGKDGNGAPRVKKFLKNSESSGLTPETIWTADEVGTNDEAKKHSNAMFGSKAFDNPKPEGLLQRILEIASNPGDLVLDAFAGSGTTGAVATKMNRRWIMVELGDHAVTHIVPRLRQVTRGEERGGITDKVGWKGGGGFRFYRLAPSMLERDRWGNWVVSKDYNAATLAEAMCRHMGFTYAPSQDPKDYWKHGYSTERDFIYVTTQALTHTTLATLSHEVGPDRRLLICCKAFNGKADAFSNLTIRKIPQAVLANCEWGRNDYSLQITASYEAPVPEPAGDEPGPEGRPRRPVRRARASDADAPGLFDVTSNTVEG